MATWSASCWRSRPSWGSSSASCAYPRGSCHSVSPWPRPACAVTLRPCATTHFAALEQSAFLGMAVFFVAAALFGFALVPILTLRRQARRTYR